MTLIAYDIDGVLTSAEGRSDFNTARKTENTVGIVTARSESSMQQFIGEQGFNPDFARSTNVKFKTLMNLEEEFGTGDVLYVGSGLRDKMAAKIAGWDYKQI